MIIFDDLAKKVLTVEQQSLKPLLMEFSKTHILVGGTAIALKLGHRQSIDFDFFIFGSQGSGKQIWQRIKQCGNFVLQAGSDLRFLSDEEEPEATLFINDVKIQLINFNRNPFNVNVNIPVEETICNGLPIPSLIDLTAMKIFAMMYRQKWKDAVDLFFLLQQNLFNFSEAMARTKHIFGILYQEEATLNTILMDNWDTNEKVNYLVANPPKDTEIREFLIKINQNYIHLKQEHLK